MATVSYDDIPAFNCIVTLSGSLTESQFRSIPLARGVAAGVCLLLCAVTLVLILYYKTVKRCLQRFFLYITLSTITFQMAHIVQLEHYFNYLNQNWRLCNAVGFLAEYTGSIQLLFSFGITIYLPYMVYRITCTPQWANTEHFKKCGKVLEGFYIAASIFLPLLFDWIPFIKVPYGEYGPWCWIKSFGKNCTEFPNNLIEQSLLWYVPSTLVNVCSALCTLFILVVFCKWQYTSPNATRQLFIKDTLLLFTLLVVNTLVHTLELAINIYSYKTSAHPYSLLMVNALSTPISRTIIPIGYLIYLHGSRIKGMIVRNCYCVTGRNYEHHTEDSSHSSHTAIRPSQSSNVPSETTFNPPYTDSLCSLANCEQ